MKYELKETTVRHITIDTTSVIDHIQDKYISYLGADYIKGDRLEIDSQGRGSDHFHRKVTKEEASIFEALKVLRTLSKRNDW